MIVVDTSALIAIFEQEPEAVAVYETGIVIGGRRGRDSAADVMQFLDELGIETVPSAEPYISRALEAYARYGKGIDPKARLNLGDCAFTRWPRVSTRPCVSRATTSPPPISSDAANRCWICRARRELFRMRRVRAA
jgi:ribonuclease VapC